MAYFFKGNPMSALIDAAKAIQEFSDKSLTQKIWELETSFQGKDGQQVSDILPQIAIDRNLLIAGITLKQVAGQINVLIHTVGILLSLPHILEEGEVIEELSLGAGNTGRNFDLATNRRIAEFKFIHWRGCAESIRQNSLFKDFFYLAEYETKKERYLYVIGDHHPLRFLNGGRALNSILTKDQKLRESFSNLYGTKYSTVDEYYRFRKDRIHLVDINEFIPEFGETFEFDD
jgi:hypothetical protein